MLTGKSASSAHPATMLAVSFACCRRTFMPALLHIDSSPRAASVSSRLAAAFVERWKRQNPGGTVFHHNTSLEHFPYLDEAAIDAFFTPAAELCCRAEAGSRILRSAGGRVACRGRRGSRRAYVEPLHSRVAQGVDRPDRARRAHLCLYRAGRGAAGAAGQTGLRLLRARWRLSRGHTVP